MTDQLDPLKSIRAMGSALEKVELVGQEKVDGTSTDHYLVTVDLAEMLAKTKAPTQGLSGLPKTVTYDMWLDEGDRPRKMAFEIAGTSLEMELSEWGEPVDIEKPGGRGHHPAAAAPGRLSQRPRMLPRIPFMLVGTGPLGIGMLERLASSALIRASTSVI